MAPKFRRAASKLDMYRKVPADLMEGTKRGSILSYLALFTIVTLFILETKAFFAKRLVTDLALDKAEERRIRLNFNITMLDLKCDWAVIDVVSSLGTDQNVSVNVVKNMIDGNGVRKVYKKGRNKNQHDIALKDDTVTQTLEQLHENGEDAISLDPKTFEYAKNENDYLFVDFYASWCSHCRDFAPTWEALAELMLDAGEKLGKQHADYQEEDYEKAQKVESPVVIAKVDCVIHHDLCQQQNIRAYPTVRLFVDGQMYGEYSGTRTIVAMVEYLFMMEENHKQHMDESAKTLHAAREAARVRLLEGNEDGKEDEKEWYEKLTRERKNMHGEWVDQDHPGCQLHGHLLLDRVPGNFHIQARSASQEFAPHMTNVSHMVNSLTVGDPMAKPMFERGQAPSFVPQAVRDKVAPMDGNVYVTHNLHEAYHHYLKLIPTSIDGFKIGRRQASMYQVIENSQLAFYRNDMIPEAKFAYDLSPIAVSYRTSSRHWYEYCTSIMAIIGGVFTVVGMIEAMIHATVSQAKKRPIPPPPKQVPNSYR